MLNWRCLLGIHDWTYHAYGNLIMSVKRHCLLCDKREKWCTHFKTDRGYWSEYFEVDKWLDRMRNKELP